MGRALRSSLGDWRIFPRRGISVPFLHKDLETYILVHGDDFFIVRRQEGRKHALGLLRGAYELSKVVTLGPRPSQWRTAIFMGRTLTLRQQGIEYEPDQQHVSGTLLALGLSDAEGVATPGTDDVGGPKASQISELRRTAKWQEVREEDDLLTGEELKLFQSVASRFNFFTMDRPDLLYSVKELMWKMGFTTCTGPHCPQESCRLRYPWTQLCWMPLHWKNPRWEVLRCGVANS